MFEKDHSLSLNVSVPGNITMVPHDWRKGMREVCIAKSSNVFPTVYARSLAGVPSLVSIGFHNCFQSMINSVQSNKMSEL